MQEFYIQATRPSKADRIPHDQAASLNEAYLRFPIQEATVSLMQAVLMTKEQFGLSYWDAAIIEAARALSCAEVQTEDLIDGQDYAGVRVVNPFRTLER